MTKESNLTKNRLEQALYKLFDRHRIVFWHDVKKELRSDYEGLQLPGIEKLELVNNEYAIKYGILREKPEQKFLIYREGAQPADLDNWLLDVQLAHGEFRTDQVAICLSELGLGPAFADLVRDHAEFYQASKRKESLKQLLKPDDTKNMIRLKMLAVCATSEPSLDAVVENLLAELSDKGEEKVKLIKRCKLDSFLWEQMTHSYGYKSDEPGLRDFAIKLFKYCYAIKTEGKSLLTNDALVFLKRWKDSRHFEACFENLSAECAEVLGIEQDLAKRDFRTLIGLDYFRLVDLKIISDLVKVVTTRTTLAEDVSHFIHERRKCHWYKEFEHIYEAIDYASQFIRALEMAKLSMDTLADGIQLYCKHWYRLDQLYRKFILNVQQSEQSSLMSQLSDLIENLYSNNYLLKLNDRWQCHLDQVMQWNIPGCVMQDDFFNHFVQPISKKNKVCVLISDALRYEIGEELASKIRSTNRYEVTLECIVSSLPSYTQLGMAALLPHKTLGLADNSTGYVMLDDRPTVGIIARDKLLKSYYPNSTAIKSEEFLKYNREQIRAFFRENDIIYIYHDCIDATGHTLKTEGRTFDAADKAVDELSFIITKLGGENYISQFIVTSDHGFIYQDRPIDESDFISGQLELKKDKHKENFYGIYYQDRRFLLGKNLPAHSSLKKFHSNQLGLVGDMEIQIPKSINRLRLQGSGSRFVHGGASLQEVVIPVLMISKKRKSDISVVEVEILRGSSTAITSGQLAVALYQVEPVTDKMQSRTLRACFYTETGEIISDSHQLTFDRISCNAREREFQVQFVFTRKADEVNNQEVILKLEEKYAGTTYYKEYKSLRYRIRRSFTSDFDF